ncbi:MAG: M42 family metallopeptidase [Planctomycetales bacterium]
MEAASLDFLKALLHAPSPSGYERPAQDVVRSFVKGFCKDVKTDTHGNVIATLNPEGSPRIMLAGHCDQIGLMVKYIDDQGYLWVEGIGGWDLQMLIGQNLQVWGKTGAVPGVIARKAIHLLTPDERKTVPEMKDLWIDIGAKDKADAESVVAIGDPVTFELGFRPLRDGLAAAPGMDNKVGAWVVMRALQLTASMHPQASVSAVSTVQEEIGLRGAITSAFTIEPQIGIAVDVTHATDCPTLDKKQHGDVKLGKGPVIYRGPNVNHAVHEKLVELAKGHNLPYQISGLAKPAGNDANVMQISRGGMATGIVAIPNRYMHSPVEVISLDDLEAAAQLISRFCSTLEAQANFTP